MTGFRWPHRRVAKTFHHPQVGTIALGFQGMQLGGTPGQRLGVYLAEPGTPDYDAMILLDMTAPATPGRRAGPCRVAALAPDTWPGWSAGVAR